MTRRALLHIGMNKTGTGAIQRTFDGYSDASWVYADLGHPNHSKLLVRAFVTAPAKRLQAAGDVEADRAAALARLEQVLSADGRSIVFSGEAMSQFGEPEAIARMLAFLRRFVSEVKVLAYVRDPLSFAPSAFQQGLRKSMPQDISRIAPRYRARFLDWVKSAGRRNVDLVPFAPAHFAKGDLLVDFARRVGLSEAHVRDHGARHNDSLSAEATAVLCALRLRMGQKRLSGPLLTANTRLLQLLATFGSEKFRFSQAALGDGLERQAADIAWVERIMGCPLPAPDLDGRRAFDGLDDIVRYAATLGPMLAAHLQGHGVDPAGAADDPVAVLERLMTQLAPA